MTLRKVRVACLSPFSSPLRFLIMLSLSQTPAHSHSKTDRTTGFDVEISAVGGRSHLPRGLEGKGIQPARVYIHKYPCNVAAPSLPHSLAQSEVCNRYWSSPAGGLPVDPGAVHPLARRSPASVCTLLGRDVLLAIKRLHSFVLGRGLTDRARSRRLPDLRRTF
jgi:hypothetical protein